MKSNADFIRYENMFLLSEFPEDIYLIYEQELKSQDELRIKRILKLMCLDSVIRDGIVTEVYDTLASYLTIVIILITIEPNI